MAKKFYGIAGENGYGVYDNYSKVLKSREYVKGYKIKGFYQFKDAESYAINMYEMLQNGASDFYRIDPICSLNWFYRRKPKKRLFEPIIIQGKV